MHNNTHIDFKTRFQNFVELKQIDVNNFNIFT